VSTTLVLTFPLGRYHATPWGRHVNEGAVEVPPAPWRVLRTLYAVWRTRVPELPGDTVHGLLAALAVPPTFHVPRHAPGHTRHYYPDTAGDPRTGQSGRDRTLDAFVVFERDADLAVVWPVDLPAGQRAALARLAGSIPYFGRADSVCSGAVPRAWTPEAHETWVPLDVADDIAPDATATAVLAPVLPLDVATLLVTPAQVRAAGLPMPRGTRLLGYQRISALPAPRPRATATAAAPTAVRFTLLQAGLPPETDALVYTDLLRQAALHRLDHRAEGTVLGGRDATGDKATSDHSHAHFLPLTEGRRLTGLVVWAPGGFPPDELKALTGLRELRSGHNDNWRATIRVAGIGDITDAAPELGAGGANRVWRTTTPFTPARFPKRRTEPADHIAVEVHRELRHRGIDTDCDVELLTGNWTAFRRYRPSAQRRGDARQGRARQHSALVRLTFTEPVPGPIALGHLAHFGLGLFVPDRHRGR
jgi:CRISPR-associated protein Csb2